MPNGRLSLVLMLGVLAACSGDGLLGPSGPSTDRFLSISAGGGLTCAVGTDQAAYCWGDNFFGQTGGRSTGRCLDGGLNPTPCVTQPQRVNLPGPVAEVRAGSVHACARLHAGDVYCWGADDAGQRGGHGTSAAPRRIGVPAAHEILVGPEHTCVLDLDGVAWCWGVNDYGQLARDTNDVSPHPQPQPIAGTLRFASFARGFSQTTCALTAEGALHCWGPDHGFTEWDGVLGFPPPDECRSNPFLRFGARCAMAPGHAVPELSFMDATVGLINACGRTNAGWVCWGNGTNGQLGIGQPQDCVTSANGIDVHTPCNRDRVPVIGSASFTAFGMGGTWACGLDATGQGWCWGANPWGDLGTGIGEHSTDVPVEIAGDQQLVALSVGSAHACGLDADGYAYCWGYARTGAIGDGSFSDSPAIIPRRVVARR